MTQANQPVRLPSSQIKQASVVLGRSFQDDPLFRYLIPDDARRARLLPSFHSITIRYAMRYGEVYTTPEIGGVSCWLPPGHTMPTIWGTLRASLYGAPVSFGLSGLRRYLPIGNYTEKVHNQAAPGPHWYLWELGVDPSRQHQGIGGLLMQPILERAARDNLPCYLETMNEINVSFYEKRGFIVVSGGVVPECGLRVWGMRSG